ncbi:MAG: hypothetical protein ACRCZD_03085, partial [Phycicoccus sp.]
MRRLPIPTTRGRGKRPATFASPAVEPDGLRLGTQMYPAAPEHTDVVLRLPAEHPSTVASFLDPAWLAVLCGRAHRCGVQVVLDNHRDGWEPLVRSTRSQVPAVRALEPEEELGSLSGSFRAPLLVTTTAAPTVGRSRTTATWTTVLLVLQGVDVRSASAAREADVVMVGRCEAEAAERLAAAMDLSSEAARVLPRLTSTQIALVEGRRLTVVDLDP